MGGSTVVLKALTVGLINVVYLFVFLIRRLVWVQS